MSWICSILLHFVLLCTDFSDRLVKIFNRPNLEGSPMTCSVARVLYLAFSHSLQITKGTETILEDNNLSFAEQLVSFLSLSQCSDHTEFLILKKQQFLVQLSYYSPTVIF